jgi:hypothetical protein
MSNIMKLFVDQPTYCAGDDVTGFLHIQCGKQDHLALVLDDSLHVHSLTIALVCVEHYSYEETTSSTDSDGNTTTSTHTVHSFHERSVISNPLFVLPTDARSFSRADSFLPVGLHHLRFKFTLPDDALASFRASTEDVSWLMRVSRKRSNGKPELLSRFEDAIVVVQSAAFAPTDQLQFSEASAKGHFVFARGDVEMHLASPQTVVRVGAQTDVVVEVSVKNNSSKTVHQLSLGLVRISGNAHCDAHETRSMLIPSRTLPSVSVTGTVVCPQITLHKKLAPGESFSFPLASVSLAALRWPADQFATVRGSTVFATLLPSPPSARLHGHRQGRLPARAGRSAAACRHCAAECMLRAPLSTASHLAIPTSTKTTPTSTILLRLTTTTTTTTTMATRGTATATATASSSSSSSSSPPVDCTAVIATQGRSLQAFVPHGISCALCPTASWGSLRIVVRGFANLKRKNLLRGGSDAFTRVEVLDWQTGRLKFSLRTAVHKGVGDLFDLADVGVFAGGAIYENTLCVRVMHRGFVDRKIGKVRLAWTTIGALKPLRESEIAASVPAPTLTDAPATIDDLETCGVWLPLGAPPKKAGDGRQSMVCLQVQRIASFDIYLNDC